MSHDEKYLAMLNLKLSALSQCFFTLFVLLFSGCATVTRSSYERFVIETEPEGAEVKLSSGETCITPCNLLKKRNEPFSCHIEKNGFASVEISIESKVAGAGVAGFAGNAAIGGVIGAGVDIYSGAALGLYPNPAIIKLQEVQSGEESRY